MKFISLFMVMALMGTNAFSQNIDGVWQLVSYNNEKVDNRVVIKIVTEGYFSLGSKDITDHSFLGAAGGEFYIEKNKLIEIRDFDTYDPSKIGRKLTFDLVKENDSMLIIKTPNEHKIWKKLNRSDQDFSGHFVITGRQKDGEMQTLTPGDRRTLKILQDGRFQWVAFNSATKELYGSGGGAYTAEDGVYTEHIQFFSKDSSRVGADLDFEYEFKNNHWYHKGKSSKGQPIYEIWSPYASSYKK